MRRFQLNAGLLAARLLVMGLLLGPLGGQAGAEPSARDIMERVTVARKLEGSEAVVSMTIVNPKGQTRERRLSLATKLYDGGKTEKRIYRFSSPADVEGTGVLVFDYETEADDVWVYLPALRKTRRIVSAQRSESFMGSEFAYADLNVPSLDDYQYQLLREESVGPERCWVIDVLPKAPETGRSEGYSRKTYWVSQDKHVIVKGAFFDLDGRALKELENQEFKLLDAKRQRYRPLRMVMTNQQNGRRSIFATEQVAFTPETSRTPEAPHPPDVPSLSSLPARMARVARILRRRHGLLVKPLFLAVFFGLVRFVVWAGMTLDPIFFPRLRRVRADRPIVLVGNPRTGTTFLQRFLVAEGFGAGMNLFLMLYPSLLLQRLLAPLLPLLEKVSPARFHSTAAHQTSLTSVETDDVAVLFRHLDGFFLYGFVLSFDEQDLLPSVDPRVRDTSARDFAWLDALWRRSLAATGADRNVAKLFSLSARLPRFLEACPGAQILYMARDPVEVIPSSMSLVTGVLDRAFGFWSMPEDVRRLWLERMYRAWIVLLQRFHDDWQSGAIDRQRVFVVRYDQMMLDFESLMKDMCQFLGHEMTPQLRATVRSRAEKQRSYASEHQYDLAQFNLTEAQVRRDCAFYYETFLPALATHGDGPGKRDASSPLG